MSNVYEGCVCYPKCSDYTAPEHLCTVARLELEKERTKANPTAGDNPGERATGYKKIAKIPTCILDTCALCGRHAWLNEDGSLVEDRLKEGLQLMENVLDSARRSSGARHRHHVWVANTIRTLLEGGMPAPPNERERESMSDTGNRATGLTPKQIKLGNERMREQAVELGHQQRPSQTREISDEFKELAEDVKTGFNRCEDQMDEDEEVEGAGAYVVYFPGDVDQ